MTSVRFGPLTMRRTFTSFLVLAVAAILPVVSVAGVCGAGAPCCQPGAADGARLTKPDCCADPCADVTRDGSSDAAKQSQRFEGRPDTTSTVAIAIEVPRPAGVLETVREPRVPPDLDRRLASLSILLI